MVTHDIKFSEVWDSYYRTGLTLIPCYGDAKRPVGNKWQETTFEDNSRKTLFENLIREGKPINYGVIAGKVSGNACAIDVDKFMLETFQRPELKQLIETAVIVKTGRAGGLGRHIWVRTDEPVDTCWTWYHNGEVAGEVRGNVNILVPPSVHPETGKSYEILSGTFENLPLVPLTRLKQLFSPTKQNPVLPEIKVIDGLKVKDAKPMRPPQTYRPDFRTIQWVKLFEDMGLVRNHQGRKVHVQCPNMANHSPDKRDQEDTSTSILIQPDGTEVFTCLHSHCKDIIDVPWLVDHFQNVIEKYSEPYHAIKQAGRVIQIREIEEPKVKPHHIQSSLPDPAKYRLYGMLEHWQNHIVNSARYHQYCLTAGALLGALGSILGRRVVDEEGVATNVYHICVAETSTGKDHIISQIEDAMSAADLDKQTGTDMTGDAAMEKILISKPSGLVLVDEVAEILQGFFSSDEKDRFSGNGKLGRLLLTLYTSSRPTKRWLGKEYAKNRQTDDEHDTRKEVWMPCVSLVGMTVPSSFYRLVSSELVDSGAMNRITVFQSENPHVTSNQNRISSAIPQWVIDRIKQLDRLPVHGGGMGIPMPETAGRPVPAFISYTPQAREVFRQMERDSDKLRLDEDIPMRELDLRAEQLAKKVALIQSIFTGEEQISEGSAIRAREMICENIRVTKLQMIQRAGDFTYYAKNVRRVLTLIQAHKDSHGVSGETMSRALRGIKAAEREEILSDLEAEGRIEAVYYKVEGQNRKVIWKLKEKYAQ